jgi:hypothetical protein
MRVFNAMDVTPQLEEIRCPTLVLHSKGGGTRTPRFVR